MKKLVVWIDDKIKTSTNIPEYTIYTHKDFLGDFLGTELFETQIFEKGYHFIMTK